MKLHLFCGDVHLPEFLNVDIIPSPAVDAAADCTDLRRFVRPGGAISLAVASAGFEHLLIENARQHLASACAVLAPHGQLIHANIPNLDEVCQRYIQGRLSLEKTRQQLLGNLNCWDGWPNAHKHLYTASALDDLLGEFDMPYEVVRYRWCEELYPFNLGFAFGPGADFSVIHSVWPDMCRDVELLVKCRR